MERPLTSSGFLMIVALPPVVDQPTYQFKKNKGIILTRELREKHGVGIDVKTIRKSAEYLEKLDRNKPGHSEPFIQREIKDF